MRGGSDYKQWHGRSDRMQNAPLLYRMGAAAFVVGRCDRAGCDRLTTNAYLTTVARRSPWDVPVALGRRQVQAFENPPSNFPEFSPHSFEPPPRRPETNIPVMFRLATARCPLVRKCGARPHIAHVAQPRRLRPNLMTCLATIPARSRGIVSTPVLAGAWPRTQTRQNHPSALADTLQNSSLTRPPAAGDLYWHTSSLPVTLAFEIPHLRRCHAHTMMLTSECRAGCATLSKHPHVRRRSTVRRTHPVSFSRESAFLKPRSSPPSRASRTDWAERIPRSQHVILHPPRCRHAALHELSVSMWRYSLPPTTAARHLVIFFIFTVSGCTSAGRTTLRTVATVVLQRWTLSPQGRPASLALWACVFHVIHRTSCSSIVSRWSPLLCGVPGTRCSAVRQARLITSPIQKSQPRLSLALDHCTFRSGEIEDGADSDSRPKDVPCVDEGQPSHVTMQYEYLCCTTSADGSATDQRCNVSEELYDDTLCIFGEFQGDFSVGDAPGRSHDPGLDVEQISISEYDGDDEEILMDREVVLCSGKKRWAGCADEVMWSVDVEDPAVQDFNEWDEADGGALDLMLGKLDRIVNGSHEDRVGRARGSHSRSSGDKFGMLRGMRALKKKLQGKK